jgi:hypothetical protein
MATPKKEKPGIGQGIIPALTGKTAEELIPRVLQTGRVIKSWFDKIYGQADPPKTKSQKKRR